MLTPDKNKKRSDVQALGSSITYGRRYQLTSMLGIMNEKDDDGEGSTTPSQPQKQPTHQSRPSQKAPKTSKTSQTSSSSKQPKTGKKQSKTASTNGAETSSVVEGEAKKCKELANKYPAVKKVCDSLSGAGLEVCEVNIAPQAEDMVNRKQLTDNEYNLVMVALGKAPG